ncbi:MAG: hypothetical protein IKE55_04905 [Kiritimatiellae bacterium]|nr:hypothetical protein [Kiritimatiellia bacterium]
MGVISITQRSERLGNIGGTSAAHGATSTDIGQVHHTVAGTFSPRFFAKNSHAGDDAIASGLGRLGDAALRIGAAVVQREEDRKVDDYANAVLDNMERMGRDDREVDDFNTPDRKHLKGQKRGFYLRTGEGTKSVVDEWDKAFADTFRKIGASIDANDRVRERTFEKLANYRRATVSRLADHQAAEYRRIELDSAKGNLATQRMIWKNGRTEVLPDIFAQQERVDTLNLATPEARKASREALAVQLTGDFIDNSLQQCATPEDFDKVEEAVKGGLKGSLPDQIADNLPGGERAVGGEVKKALLDEVKKSKRIFLAERDAQEREARQAVAKDFTEKELAIRDIPEELWADAYENLGRDQTLRKTDPARATRYLDAARDMRSAAEKAKAKADEDARKAEIKANEEGLSAALCQLQMLEIEGSMPQDAANEAQAAIWQKFRTCTLGRTVSPGFMQTFQNRMETRLSDQETNAMRKFYGLLGFHGELTGKGDVTVVAKRDAESTYKTTDGLEFDDVEMFEMGDEILRRLRSMGPEINRQGAVDEVVNDVFSKALSRKMDAEDVRDAIISGLGEYEDNFAARTNERRNGNDGKREDGE